MSIPPDTHFIPAFSIEDVLLDKDTGAPLSGGLVYFWEDSQRTNMKPVYQITGTSPNYSFIELPNPMTLSSIGTFVDALGNPVIPYFFPYTATIEDPFAIDLYYVQVTNSMGVPQFTREAQPFIQPTGSSSVSNAFTNELSNPQFIDVLFDTTTASTYTYNFNGVTDEMVLIAPDWYIVVTSPGVGSVVVAQNNPDGLPTGDLNLITNPGTYLNINSTGLTTLRLRQRIFGSPNLWGNGFISGSFVAKNESGSSAIINMLYSQSSGTVVDQNIVSATVPATGTFNAYPGSVLIPISDSTDFYPGAYVDIDLDLPVNVEMDITSVMLTPTGTSQISAVIYDQTTTARQQDQLFHYFQPQLNFKPIPSLLTGWDFPLNPAQAKGTSVTIPTSASIPTAANCYAWDQTISNSLVSNISVIRNTITGGFQATTAGTNEAFYLIQYLTGTEAQEILGNNLAVNINAFRTQAGGAVTCKVFLYVGKSAATFPTLPTMIGTVVANGDFTLTAANWSLIPRSNMGTAQGSLSVVNTADYTTLNDVVDLNFNGWQFTDKTVIANTNKFAIVVTFSCPTAATVVTVDSISMMKGDIATRPAAKTLNQVLFECQYYYQKSFPIALPPSNSTGFSTGEAYGVQAAASGVAVVLGPVIRFSCPMRAVPAIALFNPNNTNSLIVNGNNGNDWQSTSTTQPLTSLSSISTIGFETWGQTPVTSSVGQSCAIHWAADARLGIVA